MSIGTATPLPAYKLDVAGAVHIASSLMMGGPTSDKFLIRSATLGDGSTVMGRNIEYWINDGIYHAATGTASAIDLSDGLKFYAVPSGAAGTAFAVIPALTVINSGNVGIGTTTPDAKLHVVGGAIVGGSGTNIAAVTNIDFTTGNVQTSANSTNNAAIKICGMKDGGSYTLVMKAQPVGSTPVITAFSDAACTAALTVDAGGVALTTTSATTLYTFIRAANTVYIMPATGYTN
ncbi:MAG: hypothetical protein V4692_12790 [Bdellovibrionota bacterium]